jgi:CubicO group peptidase (beta-lactamase class C family)
MPFPHSNVATGNVGHRLVILLAGLLVTCCRTAPAVENVFPNATWQAKAAQELKLDKGRLDAVASTLGGRGCIIKNGYVVKQWGDQALRKDWASSAKPVLSTLLMFALQERKIKSFDQPVADFGWELLPKDRSMTLRHLASMTGGYARPEKPGEAWAYNDYAIQLYQKTLFDKIFQGDPDTIFHDAHRFGPLQLEDGFAFRKTNRRISASVRDFARVAWFWLNRGNWNGVQLLPRQYFDDNMRPQVPPNLPLSSNAKTNDYLHIGTYGGESNHFSKAGPGMYGFNWWFNGKGGTSPNTPNWPDAPADTFMSLGARGNSSAIMPSLNLVVVAAEADWGELDPGNAEAKMNQRLKQIVEAGTP